MDLGPAMSKEFQDPQYIPRAVTFDDRHMVRDISPVDEDEEDVNEDLDDVDDEVQDNYDEEDEDFHNDEDQEMSTHNDKHTGKKVRKSVFEAYLSHKIEFRDMCGCLGESVEKSNF